MEHRHGFMASKGIQEPSLIVMYLSKNWINPSTYQSSVDIEKAFDRLSHAVIIQALCAFGVPELLIQALQNYFLTGYAKVKSMVGKGTHYYQNQTWVGGPPLQHPLLDWL
jgi:hypothetical protein